MQEQIVVVGFGWVGQANALALKLMGYDVAYFDPGNPPHHYEKHAVVYRQLARLSSVLERDDDDTSYIVCVGDRVSDEGVQDISLIKGALDSLKGAKGIVILRSTILPDHLDSLKFDFYVPEFLHEKKAVEECLTPYFFVVGAAGTVRKAPSFFEKWRTDTPRYYIGTPREAAFIKYLSNIWNAARIAFVNEFGDTIAEPTSKENIESSSRVIEFLFRGEAYLKYGRGFDGHCLPKDTRAYARWYHDKGKNVELLKGAIISNSAHIQLEKKNELLPRWFSEWPTPHISGFVAIRELWYSIKKNVRDPRGFLERRRNRLID